jgi:putative DNA primase/helicase
VTPSPAATTGRIPDYLLDEIRQRMSLVELVREFTKLKKSGKELAGRCPFHEEKEPSFSVNAEKGVYFCYGCGAGGNLFDFEREARGGSFLDAARRLAERAGVDLHTNGSAAPVDATVAEERRLKRREDRQRREAEEEEEYRRAAEQAQAEWEKATPATPDHPYLKKKGVTDVTDLRVDGNGWLLIPMKGTEDGTPLHSLQRISPEGAKRFFPGGRVRGTRTTIGAGRLRRGLDRRPEPGQSIYLCEGWATGWSISGSADAPVLVAFTLNNLNDIAAYAVERFPDLTVVIAADNDRWKRGPKGVNPGVIAAQEAAEATGALVAIPDFPDLAGKPTDFNDLYLQGGPEAVVRWLDPDLADDAVTEAPDLPPLESAPPRDEPPISTPEGEAGPRDLTHDGLALELGDQWRNEARHVAAWGRWFFWTGQRWEEDGTLEHLTRTRAFLREVTDRLGPEFDASAKKRLRQADTVTKVASLARSNVAQAATVEQFDANPWLLGTPGGTVDLRTGELRPAVTTDYITKTTSVAPAPAGTIAPLFVEFLDQITDGDTPLIEYLQRFFGYALTGSTREHAFIFGHGTGANGKGVLISTLKGILGSYAAVIPTEMLMVSQTDRHPTELARLRGIRLAIGSETEQGKRWAEAQIKALTGGDPIAARFMRQDFFEFEPQFKLFVVGNHRPSIRGVDEAMRRRLHFVPFTVTIPEEERDYDLPERLRAEWPAILRWAIDGCLSWQRVGLDAPHTVRAATQDYLEDEDAPSLWMEECAVREPDAWEASGTLFASWRTWAEAAGEFVGSKRRFSNLLQERGFEPEKSGGVRGYRGIRLNRPDSAEDGGRWEP